MSFRIFYDSLQEGEWFKRLHPRLEHADLLPFDGPPLSPALRKTLSFDRPDIVLADTDVPILVLERTVEVPTGHNVGQRFARLVAAAQMKIPVVYFGPYAAYKHGGKTRGPRYMNLRLFYALKEMARIEDAAVTIINWPVDRRFEIIKAPGKDARLRLFLELYFKTYRKYGVPGMNRHLVSSSFEQEQERERAAFVAKYVARPREYDLPPDSVVIARWQDVPALRAIKPGKQMHKEVVVYEIGMRYIRSDPYTGTALLYSYLYCGGLPNTTRHLILHFPHIRQSLWRDACRRPNRKDVRLFRLAADGILFADGYVEKDQL
jgi:hypothetical protein